MAYTIVAKTNTDAAAGAYIYGKIRDDTTPGTGTPVNTLVYGDFHQFFARMAAMAGITLNNLPDNNTNGFQFFEALLKVTQPDWGNITSYFTTLEGSWAASAALTDYDPGYKTSVNETALCGVVVGTGSGSGTWTAGTKTMFTIPVAGRPAKNVKVDARVIKDSVVSIEQLSIDYTSGDVSFPILSGTYTTITVYLDGITFRKV